jgi:BirA family biotin operon repressor/biotin-[acetyl-CoA-carboxylase] ligase
MREPRAFDRELFESLVHARDLELGRSFLHYPTTNSTNDVVLQAMSEGGPHGLVVLAEHQTAGRGRRGRTWLSERAGENLLFTVLMRPERSADNVSSVTLAIGLGVRDALQPHLDEEVSLKWTNDILVNDRKLVGILVESQVRNAELSLAVGIGLNVHMRDLPEEIRTIATSLSLLEGRELRREHLLADVLEHVGRRFQQWQAQGFAGMVDDFRACDALVGRLVSVDGLEGRARGVADDGALLLQVGEEPDPRRMINGIVEFV